VTLCLSSYGELADGGRSCREARPEAAAAFRGQLVIMRMKGRQTILGGCCTRCMLYSEYAELGVCCTRCMPYVVYAVLGVHS